MCGIAGTLGVPAETARRTLEKMCRALAHRGPDDQGLDFVAGDSSVPPVALGHTRLAIIDLSSGGHQPMRSASGRSCIVYNGEIYNYLALRRELASRGAALRTASDTEVVLAAYEAWGNEAVDRLHGMFAFCLVDRERGTVLFCRDRLGQKPLYVADVPSGGIVFASEMRALLASDLVPRRVDRAALTSFLAQGMVCGSRAIVEGVRLVPPGTWIELDFAGRESRRARYWTAFAGPSARGPSYRQSTRAIGATLREAVAEHLIADVPLGIFLSGGVDSAAVATIATEVSTTKINSITIGFDDAGADESLEAQAVARELGTDHQTVRIGGREILEDIDEVFASMDQPTVDGFNTYFAARAAKRAGLTAALSGVGGDELFGGYASFRDVPRALAMSRFASRVPFAAPALARMVRLTGGRRGVKAAETIARRPDVLGAYLLRRELFLEAERRELGAHGAAGDESTGLPPEVLNELHEAAGDGADPINSVSRLELAHYMRDMLLRDSDAFSMASRLELRLPLLDDRIVEAASRLPGRWKSMRSHPKAFLVDAIGPRFPRRVVQRPKRGFAFPWEPWLRGPLRERARNALEDGGAWRALGLDHSSVLRMWQRFSARDPRVGASQIIALWVLTEHVRRTGLRVGS